MKGGVDLNGKMNFRANSGGHSPGVAHEYRKHHNTRRDPKCERVDVPICVGHFRVALNAADCIFAVSLALARPLPAFGHPLPQGGEEPQRRTQLGLTTVSRVRARDRSG